MKRKFILLILILIAIVISTKVRAGDVTLTGTICEDHYSDSNIIAQCTINYPCKVRLEAPFSVRLGAGFNVNIGCQLLAVTGDGLQSDTDGMPDWWENQYPTVLNPSANDAFVDSDGDGYRNLREFLGDSNGRTNPTDPGSHPNPITIYVNNAVSNIEQGSQAKPFHTIKNGIDCAATGDTVLVLPGTYTGPDNRNLEFNKDIKLRSHDGPDVTIIDPQGQGRAFWFHSGETVNAELDGFTITGGQSHVGAGILIDGCSPTIKNCIIRNNSAYAVYYSWGYPIAYGSGGGICCTNGCLSIISHCRISQNYGCVIGGGIFSSASNISLINCTIADNSGFWGGGIFCVMGTATFTNCTIANNLLHTYYGTVPDSGGLACQDVTNLTVNNSIVWGNNGSQIYNTNSSITVSFSDIQGDWSGAGSNNIAGDPLFVPDYHLQPTSPCRNTGDPSSAFPADDIDNESRPQNGVYDMGADEFYDSDGDQIPDYWEDLYGLNKNDPNDAGLDIDSDGLPSPVLGDELTNLEEYNLGTNPLSKDSDNDGMWDAWEDDYGLNPADASDADLDKDNDGLTNLMEYKRDKDPTNNGDASTGIYYEYDALGRIKSIKQK